MKVCPQCRIARTIDEFHRTTRQGDECRECYQKQFLSGRGVKAASTRDPRLAGLLLSCEATLAETSRILEMSR